MNLAGGRKKEMKEGTNEEKNKSYFFLIGSASIVR
jgi:hypothetical protein